MIDILRDIVLARRYRFNDREIGLLRRVHGWWKVDEPDIAISVPIKLEGSSRFGPDRKALNAYKKYRDQIPGLWEESQKRLMEHFRMQSIGWPVEETTFVLYDVIVMASKEADCDVTFSLDVVQDDCCMYSVLTKEGKVKGYERVSHVSYK